MIGFKQLKFDIGMEDAIRGMRNSYNSWDKSDSKWVDLVPDGIEYEIGEADKALCRKLVKAGPAHRKFLRMIFCYCDITAPMYWWKQFDTYKVGTVANSTSTMHKILDKEFSRSDFSFGSPTMEGSEYWDRDTVDIFDRTIDQLNRLRKKALRDKDHRKYYEQVMYDILPSSYNQMRTVCMSYEVLYNIWLTRRGHKLGEWKEFIDAVCVPALWPFVEEMDKYGYSEPPADADTSSDS